MQRSVLELIQRIDGGVLPAMVTPLAPDGYRVDLDQLPRLVDFLIDSRVKGLFVGGTTGEGVLLDLDQRRALHEGSMAAVGGRVPVLLHAGTNNTRDTAALTRQAAELGADGVVVITPTFYGMPDDDLLSYFQETAALAPQTPFFVYDIPQMAVNGVSPSLLRQMMRTISNLAGVKCSRPDAQVIRQLIDVGGSEAVILAGNERIALGSLALGAAGLISGLATAVPKPFVALAAAHMIGDRESARLEQRRINCLLDGIPAGNRIGALKLILEQRGISVGPVVPPRQIPSDPDLWARLSAIL